MLKALERWASVSDERSRLVIILVWIGLALLVVMTISITAWVMLPGHTHTT